MADKQLLKDMIKKHVNGDMDGAGADLHSFLSAKMREISTGQTDTPPSQSAAPDHKTGN